MFAKLFYKCNNISLCFNFSRQVLMPYMNMKASFFHHYNLSIKYRVQIYKRLTPCHHFPPVNCIQDWLANCPTASSINTNVHQPQEEMDQNQATPQPLHTLEELVSVRYSSLRLGPKLSAYAFMVLFGGQVEQPGSGKVIIVLRCVPLCTNNFRNSPGLAFYRIPKAYPARI